MSSKNNIRRHMSALALALLACPILTAGSAMEVEEPAQPESPPTPARPEPKTGQIPDWAAPIRGAAAFVSVEPYEPPKMAYDPPRARRRSKRGQRSAVRKGWMR